MTRSSVAICPGGMYALWATPSGRPRIHYDVWAGWLAYLMVFGGAGVGV
jgi:hypothetical protein